MTRHTPSIPTIGILAALASGCWLSSGEIDKKVKRDPDPDLIRFGAIDPDSGTVDGGTQVLIDAAPLGDTLAVYFANAPAEVIDYNKKQILVRSPPSPLGGAGCVDITVTSDDRTGALTTGYCYVTARSGEAVLDLELDLDDTGW